MTTLPPLSLLSVGPSTILPGTKLVLRGTGFMPEKVADLQVAFVGSVGDHFVEVVFTPARTSDEEITVSLDGASASSLTLNPGTFVGHVSVTRTPRFDAELETSSLSISVAVAHELVPALNSVTPTIFRPGDVLDLSGTDFIYESEGGSTVVFNGVFRTDSPASEVPIEDLEIAAEPPDPTDRGHLELRVGAALFGVHPGSFVGALTLRNSPVQGAPALSSALEPGVLRLEGPLLESVSPTEASRGQRVTLNGQGLLPADALEGSGTVFLLEGVLDADRGPDLTFTADAPLAVFPDVQPSSQEAQVILHAQRDEDGNPMGLGAAPGHFEGHVSPMLFHGGDRTIGEPFPLSFHIHPDKQVVFLRFLPAFDDALVAFGLLTARSLVIARAREVVERDYAGVNIAIELSAPEDFAEYMIVEIGGEDPNGTGLFGLDNTAGKDTGNLRFDDVIGGFNADTRARGYAAYGGIFVTEMLRLSPILGEGPLVDPRFDEIFADLAPALGGSPALQAEADGSGSRAPAVAEASRVLGNLVGSTISHEAGHALGLTAGTGSFHNEGDNPGWIMDAGIHRPFGERAEIGGEGPAIFSPVNRAYLEEILPL